MDCIDGTQAHIWIIEPAAGPISGACCSRCRQTRTFDNAPVGTWQFEKAIYHVGPKPPVVEPPRERGRMGGQRYQEE